MLIFYVINYLKSVLSNVHYIHLKDIDLLLKKRSKDIQSQKSIYFKGNSHNWYCIFFTFGL